MAAFRPAPSFPSGAAPGRLAAPRAAALPRAARRALERRVGRRLLDAVPGAPFALRLPDGETLAAPGVPPRATLAFRDTGALLGMLGPEREVHFGDAYAAGRIDVEGALLDVLLPVFEAPKPDGLLPAAGRLWKRARRRRNGLRGARDHIHHH